MKRRTGISTFEYLLVLIGLTAAAAAAVYFLYLRPPPGVETGREVAVKKISPTPPPKPRVTHRFTPEEQKAREMAAVLSETPKPSDSPAQAPDQTSSSALDEGKTDQEKPPGFQDTGSAQPSGIETSPTLAKEEEPESKTAEPAETGATPSGPVEQDSEPTPLASTPPPPEPATPEKETLPPKAKTVWAINALSTLDEDRALRLLDALMKQPYHVYSYQKEIKGQNWYRIRVGFFQSRAEAERVGLELARKHQLPPPWIVKPGPSEIHRYYQPK